MDKGAEHKLTIAMVSCGGCGWMMEHTDQPRWYCTNGACKHFGAFYKLSMFMLEDLSVKEIPGVRIDG